MAPTVTIIVTVYQRTQFLRQAVQSALDQTFGDFEIIVTDDSNSQAIKSICDAFQSPFLRYRANETNLGVVLNIRAAIEESQGRYIAFLNDDDVWETEFLEKLVAPLEADSNRVLAFSDHHVILEDGRIDVAKTDENTAQYGRNTLPPGEVVDAEKLVLGLGIPLAMASVFRKDAIDWNLLVKDVSGAYDFWLACSLVASKRPVYYVAERLTRYRTHTAMETSRKAPDKNENLVFIYRKLRESKAFLRHEELIGLRYSQALYQVGRDKLLFNRVREARSYFSQALKIAQNNKATLGLMATYLPKPLRTILRFTA